MAIPKSMQQKYDEIAPLIIEFCDYKLNEEYKDLCLRLLEKLCRKRPSPLLSGKAQSWAAGVVYAIGANNFIFDNTQAINMTGAEIAEPFGVAASTASAKATQIRRMVNISYFMSEWSLKKVYNESPMTWMVEVNGLIVDARWLPIAMQQMAYERGLIPYVPGEAAEK